ncbi:tRNA lysidine(34) synthetase TilS [Candidatus Annandia adelgestsuga]|uniref:tRNA lysidine(34) synthetase TilS n=1 Tax=Candidatus Annandia adelgestsuga TaxID=1302411 RepID=UPI000F7EA884|nr:tRNA lysidine(34) synthetase TilS [Candidatus Annandia adelgestsuga]
MLKFKFIKNIIYNYNKILIAYSGGLDSTFLLYNFIIFRKYFNINIRAIYINHKLNFNSNIWINHCKEQCYIWKVPLIIKTINIKKNNIENNARILRYKVIKKNLLINEILLTAHHMDDQCETFFLSLKRGSGSKGLSSIPFKKKFFNTVLIRPLLNYTKNKIKKISKNNFLTWINDSSNLNNKYDRNFLRNKILPLINKRWCYFLKNVNKSINLYSNQEKLLNKLSNNDFKKICLGKNMLNILYLKKINKIYTFYLLKKWIKKKTNYIPSYNIINSIYKEIINPNFNIKPKFIIKNYIIKKYSKNIFIINLLKI